MEFQNFALAVAAMNIPKHLQTLTLDVYVGGSNPVHHLWYYNTKMVIGRATNAVKCRLLPSTFKGTTMTWFIKQPHYYVRNFTDLSTNFLTQFSANQDQKATTTDLFNVHQQGEMIKTYMMHLMKDANPLVCVAAFKHGLRAGSLNNDLTTLQRARPSPGQGCKNLSWKRRTTR